MKIITSCFFVFIHCLFALKIRANPFAINFPAKEQLTDEDYLYAQATLRTLNIHPLLSELYPTDQGLLTFEDFYGRASVGLNQILIAPQQNLFPVVCLKKIGKGGDNCIVSFASYNRNYAFLLRSIPKALSEVGFDGYFLCRIGGFPNPTGREIRYVGVPYCFKIFMMLEAHKLGFNKILWIDSAMLPLRDPTPLFDWIDKTGSLIYGWQTTSEGPRAILPATHKLLKTLTSIDVLDATYVRGGIFGLNIESDKAKKFIDSYYALVEMGTPFLSCYPEEFVLSAILGQVDPSKDWKPCSLKRLLATASAKHPDSKELIQKFKKKQYFFYQRQH